MSTYVECERVSHLFIPLRMCHVLYIYTVGGILKFTWYDRG